MVAVVVIIPTAAAANLVAKMDKRDASFGSVPFCANGSLVYIG